MKPVIIAIVGASGSGKTTLSKLLENQMGILSIVSYTTRPKREDETNGVEHWFVNESDMPDRELMLAYTVFSGYHYWATHRQVQDAGIISYVIDEIGLRELMVRYGTIYEVVPILVKRDKNLIAQCVDQQRIQRDEERELIPEKDYMGIIYNNGSMEELLAQAKTILKTII